MSKYLHMNLYKYYSPKDYNFDVVETNSIFFSLPGNLNDPFDVSDILFPKSFYESIHMVKGDSNGLDTHAICCFSKGARADNPHMWSFYAAGYTGFAIEFDKTDLETNITPKYALRPGDVTYKDGVIDVSSTSKDKISCHLPDTDEESIATLLTFLRTNPIDDLIDDIFRASHLIKDNMWKAENEWRLIIGRLKSKKLQKVEGGYLCKLSPNSMKSLILGMNMSDENKKIIIEKNLKREHGPLPIKIIKPFVDESNRPAIKIIDTEIKQVGEICRKYELVEV